MHLQTVRRGRMHPSAGFYIACADTQPKRPQQVPQGALPVQQKQNYTQGSQRSYWVNTQSLWDVCFTAQLGDTVDLSPTSTCFAKSKSLACSPTFSPCNEGTESRKPWKLSLMWSLRLRSSALWCARLSACKGWANFKGFCTHQNTQNKSTSYRICLSTGIHSGGGKPSMLVMYNSVGLTGQPVHAYWSYMRIKPEIPY